MALTPIQQVRMLIQDNSPGLYILSDDEIQFFIDGSGGNTSRASLEAAKVILFKLALQSVDEKVDILSISGSKASEQYRLALMLYLKDPGLNPVLSNLKGWVGGISRTEMALNDSVADNNFVQIPGRDYYPINTDPFAFPAKVFVGAF